MSRPLIAIAVAWITAIVFAVLTKPLGKWEGE